MKKRTLGLLTLLSLASFITAAQAHYLWVSVDEKTGDHGTANLYFEEGPWPGDGHYLPPFIEHGKMWVRVLGTEKPIPMKMTVIDKPDKKQKWLSSPLPKSGPRSVESYGKFGVYSYGKTEVLLHYYAKFLDVKGHDDLQEMGESEELKIQLVPHDMEDQMELTMLWDGKPAANRPVYIRGPKKFRKNLKSDENGKVKFPIENEGRYIARTYMEFKESGKDGDREYELIRHHGSLTMDLPLEGP